jgi:hypothetical protein
VSTENLSGLEHLGQLGLRGADMRPALLRVLTELYVQKLTHTAEEERHYTELALRLLDSVDAATRAAVAERLGRHLSPPRRVIEHLAAATPVSAAVSAAIPAALPATAPAEWHEDAAPGESSGLFENEGQDTITADAADIDGDWHSERVDRPPQLETSVAGELNELFFAANAEERRLILLNLPVVIPTAAASISLRGSQGIAERLEAAALGRNREDFARCLARALRISNAQATRIARDELGEPTVIAAKALALPRDVLYRILMFVNTTVGHSVERVHALAALYDDMTREAAEQLVAIWRALNTGERRQAGHQPLHWDEDSRHRARGGEAVKRPSPRPARDRREAS